MAHLDGLNARLVVYAPNGDRLGFLPYPESWDASFTFNDVPALGFVYPRESAGSEYLRNFCEVAIEVNAWSQWIEPFNARYLRLDVEDDSTGMRIPAYKCAGYASLLEGAVVLPRSHSPNASEYDKDGKRKFLSASVGQILATILAEAKSYEPELLPGLSLGFTQSADANGDSWAKRITIYYEPGTSLLTVLDNLAQAGQCDWVIQGRTLRVFNPAGDGVKPRYRLHTPALEAPVRSTARGLVHNVLLVGEEKTWKKTNPGALQPWGKSVTVISQGGVKDEATASELIGAKLAEGRTERVEYSLNVPLHMAPYPLVDYKPGEWVEHHNRAGEWEPMRVHQVTLRFSGGNLTAVLTLNDRFIDASVRAAKRQKGIVNGASGDAGAGNIPKPESPVNAVPKAPEGLVVHSVGYFSEGGKPLSSVKASWAPVQYDVNGYTVDVAEYEVNVHVSTVTTSEFTATVDNLPVGAPALIRVRAVSRSSVKSAWAETTVKTEPPLATLPAPAGVNITCTHGIIEVTWAGQFQEAGSEPVDAPSYFERLDVYEAESTLGPWTLVGNLIGKGGTLTLDRQNILGSTRWYQCQGVNVLEQAGDKNQATQVRVVSALDEAIKQARAKTAELAAAKVDIKRLITSGVKFDPNVVHQLTADTTFANDLVANRLVISENNPATAVMIADGAVTASKILADEALARKIFTDSLAAGKITTRMFSTQAGFEGDGVRIDRGGVAIRGAGKQGIFLNPTYGLFSNDANGNTNFRVDIAGNAYFKGEIKSGSTITGATIEGSIFRSYSGSSLTYFSQGGVSKWLSPLNSEDNIEINSQYFQGIQRPAVIFNGTCSSYQITQPGGIYLSTSSERIRAAAQLMQGALVMEAPTASGEGVETAICGVGHHNTWTLGADFVAAEKWRAYIRGNGGVESYTGFRPGTLEIYANRRVEITADETHINGLEAYTGGYPLVQPQNSGRVYYQGSARRFKDSIRDVPVNPYALLGLRPRAWYDKGDVEKHAFYLEDRSEGGANTGKWDAWKSQTLLIPGLIAEEVEDAGLGLFVTYNRDGEVQGLQYDRLWTLLIPVVRELVEKIEKLERKE